MALAVPALGGPSNPISTSAAKPKAIAKKALARANQAITLANEAKSAADAAATLGANAKTTADGAKTAADAAQAAADAAQTSANAAQATADTKFGVVDFVAGAGSASDSVSPKGDNAVCPAGTALTGGEFLTSGAGNNDITPTINASYGNAWVVTMEEIGAGTADNWSVQANARCADQS